MSQLNSNIPYIRGFVLNAYLYSDFSRIDLTECYIFGVKAVINRPLLFHCQLDNGAVFWSLPLSAFCLSEEFDRISENQNERLSMLQWWDMQSNDIAVTVFTYLQGYDVDLYRRNKTWAKGKYLFTIDDYYSDHSAMPCGYACDPDSKCFHVIKGEDFNLYAYPNTYLRWHNLNFVDPYDQLSPPRYKASKFEMKCEYENGTVSKKEVPLRTAGHFNQSFIERKFPTNV